MLVDPQSYETYVKRQTQHRAEIDRNRQRDKYTPGSGYVWTNRITKPQQFNLLTETKDNSSLHIKSISKVCLL